MSEPLNRLVYISQNLIPGDEAQVKAEIEQILETSRRNNSKVGVTGALMYNSGCFTQILEGEQSHITGVFERIQRDTRHSDVVVLEFGPADRRDFADWSMGFVGREDGAVEPLKDAVTSGSFDVSALESRDIYKSVYGLMKNVEPAMV